MPVRSNTSLEQILARAADEPDFAAELLRDWRSALTRSPVSEVDAQILASVSNEQLGEMIRELGSSRSERRAVLQTLGAGVLATVAATAAGCECIEGREGRDRILSLGIRPQEPPPLELELDDLSVQGALDVEAVRRVLLRQLGQSWPVKTLEACLERAERKLAVSLSAKLSLEVDGEGAVRSARTTIVRPEDALLVDCLGAAARRWRLPRPGDGASATISAILTVRRRAR